MKKIYVILIMLLVLININYVFAEEFNYIKTGGEVVINLDKIVSQTDISNVKKILVYFKNAWYAEDSSIKAEYCGTTHTLTNNGSNYLTLEVGEVITGEVKLIFESIVEARGDIYFFDTDSEYFYVYDSNLDDYFSDGNIIDDLPPIPIDPEREISYDYNLIYKNSIGQYVCVLSDTEWYAYTSDSPGYEGIWIETIFGPDNYGEHKIGYEFIYNSASYSWDLVTTFKDGDYGPYGLRMGFDIDEVLYTLSPIRDRETNEIVIPSIKSTDHDEGECYIEFESPQHGFSHNKTNLEFRVKYRVPVGGNTKHRPLISNSINFNLVEHNYDEIDGYYEGYFIFTSDVEPGYTTIVAKYNTTGFDLSGSISTYRDKYFIDNDGDGIDDNTGLEIEDGIINIDTMAMQNKLLEKLNVQVFTNTFEKIKQINTEQGEAPKIKLNLYNMFTAVMDNINSDVSDMCPFEDEETVIIDFARLEEIQFMDMSVIEYFRLVLGSAFVIITFLYCYNKIYPKEVIL